MHYVGWHDLCLPCDQGGLGFHDLTVWRGPLRARLAWTVINEPDSLLHKVVTAKYGADLWQSVRTSKCSATWRIIREGMDALSAILRWRIGDGRCVRILQDCWILDRKIGEWPTFVNVEEVDNARVCNLLTDSLEWNEEVVNRCFGPIMAQRILEIGTNRGEGTDMPELTKSCFGSSLSAVAYRSKVQGPECEFGWLHNLKLHPREKFHWWRLLRNAVPTNVWLHRRGLSSTRLCPWGCDMEENTEHCITCCHMLRKVGRILAKWGFTLPQYDSLAAAMEGLAAMAASNRVRGLIFCYAVYQVWRARNDLKHTGTSRPPSVIAATVLSLLPRTYSMPILEQWSYPQPSGLFPDHSWDAFQAEVLAATAIREVIREWMYDLDGIVIEGDCSNAIRWLQHLHDRHHKAHYNFEGPDLTFLLNFKQVLFRHTRRECNRPANFCATLALSESFVFWDENAANVPLTFLSLLRDDSHRFTFTYN
ncbi:putative mitochondrial protein [Dendrobium catenatum]|uniref:Putative mitochondrial protein n=1 Tax=Dendrobium catenatum TaxID=906689 RepID=A0A2I0VVG5_9ASPA|nr:putative mitochondrial protein [Dendrobium catenatum]